MKKKAVIFLLPSLLLFSCWGPEESSSSYSKESIPEPPYTYVHFDFDGTLEAKGNLNAKPYETTLTFGGGRAEFVSDYPPVSTGDFFDETYYKALEMAGNVSLTSSTYSLTYEGQDYVGETGESTLLLYTNNGDFYLDTRELAVPGGLPLDILLGQFVYRNAFEGLNEKIPEEVKAFDVPLEDVAGMLESVVWNDDAASCLSLEILDKENFIISFPLNPSSVVIFVDALSTEPMTEEEKQELLDTLSAFETEAAQSYVKVIYDAKEKRLSKTQFDVSFHIEEQVLAMDEINLTVDELDISFIGEISWGRQEDKDTPDYSEFKEL